MREELRAQTSVGCCILSNYVPETFLLLFTANACADLHKSIN